MRKFLFASVLSLAAFLFLVPAPLRADGLTFTFGENVPYVGAVTLTWQLPANPVPDFAESGAGFAMFGVPITISLAGGGSIPVSGNLEFLTDNSGLEFLADLPVSLSGVSQLYFGDENSPTFIPGIYQGFDVLTGAPEATLVIATPEPPSVLMYLVGFLALAGVFVVRKVQG